MYPRCRNSLNPPTVGTRALGHAVHHACECVHVCHRVECVDTAPSNTVLQPTMASRESWPAGARGALSAPRGGGDGGGGGGGIAVPSAPSRDAHTVSVNLPATERAEGVHAPLSRTPSARSVRGMAASGTSSQRIVHTDAAEEHEDGDVDENAVYACTLLLKLPFNTMAVAEERAFQVVTYDELGDKEVEFLAPPQPTLAMRRKDAYLTYWKPRTAWLVARFTKKQAVRKVVPLSRVSWVRQGHTTFAFDRFAQVSNVIPDASMCFTVMTTTRSIDCVCYTAAECRAWVAGLNAAMRRAQTAIRAPGTVRIDDVRVQSQAGVSGDDASERHGDHGTEGGEAQASFLSPASVVSAASTSFVTPTHAASPPLSPRQLTFSVASSSALHSAGAATQPRVVRRLVSPPPVPHAAHTSGAAAAGQPRHAHERVTAPAATVTSLAQPVRMVLEGTAHLEPALFAAIEAGDARAVETALDNGASHYPCTPCPYRRSPECKCTTVVYRTDNNQSARACALVCAPSALFPKCAGCALECRDARTHDTPLIHACRKNEAQIVGLLLQRGACFNPNDSHGFNALQWACTSGAVDAAAEIVHVSCLTPGYTEHIMRLTDRVHGDTPLHMACRAAKPALVKLLLDSWCVSSSHWAFHADAPNCVRTLLGVGTDLTRVRASTVCRVASIVALNSASQTPLHVAVAALGVCFVPDNDTVIDVSNASPLFADHTSTNGASSAAASAPTPASSGATIAKKLAMPADADKGVGSRMWALATQSAHAAAAIGRLRPQNAGHGPDLVHLPAQAHDAETVSPTTEIMPSAAGMESVQSSAHGQLLEVIDTLLEYGADETVDWFDARQFTPLHYAVQHSAMDVMELLLHAGANPNACASDADAVSPLQLAERISHPIITRALRKYATGEWMSPTPQQLPRVNTSCIAAGDVPHADTPSPDARNRMLAGTALFAGASPAFASPAFASPMFTSPVRGALPPTSASATPQVTSDVSALGRAAAGGAGTEEEVEELDVT
ncbi:MAG: hypothetical protein EOO41_00160, partial [Methanobacteriota archaeon]